MRNLKRNLPPLTSLIAFEAAARLGSFSDAARELNVTREAISRQIRALETHLGMSLFDREANATTLRDWGRRYFEIVSGSLENIARVSVGLRGASDETPVDNTVATESGERSRILIVDDMAGNINRLKDVLSDHYDVIAYTDPHAALEWMATGGAVALVLLDVRMHGINGYELCRRLKLIPHYANIPVMFLTSLDTPDDETQGFAVGACDYIARPFVPAILLARIRVQLDLRETATALEAVLQRRADRLERAEAALAAIRTQLDQL